MTFKNYKKIISTLLCFFLIISLFLSITNFSVAKGQTDFLVEAPLPNSFLEYQKDFKSNNINELLKYKIIPSPINRDNFSSEKIAPIAKTFEQAKASLYPSRYDLRDFNKTSPAKEQIISGPCWTFATMASIESSLLPNESFDFSENNLKNTHGFDWSIADGGNGDMATAYLSRWSGPILENLDKYSTSSNISPTNLSPEKHVQEVLYLPKATGPLDLEPYKKVITNYGAIFTYMKWMDGSDYYNSETYGYYYSSYCEINHAITVVGWDDNYSSSNFSSLPPGNGAWIVKNSFGSSFGDKGYFYISYYDTVIFKDTESFCFNNAEPASNYSMIYQYDPLGVVNQVGYSLEPTVGWMANIFTAKNNDGIKAVSFYTPEENCKYEVYIYKTWDGTNFSGVLSSWSGSFEYGGYHTVSLPSPAEIEDGNKFGVVVKITTNSFNWPISLETRLEGYSSKADSSIGESFYSPNGKSWTDVTDRYPGGNACIKAFSGGGNIINSGNIIVNAYLDGVKWNGNILFNISGNTNISGTSVPSTFSGLAGSYSFSYISGGPLNSILSKVEPTSSFDVSSNAIFSVNLYFSSLNYKLMITKNPLEGGSWYSDPVDINNLYPKGTFIKLTAEPSTGFAFSGWSGDINSESSSVSILMDSDKNIVANFKPIPILTLATPKLTKIEISSDRTVLIKWDTVPDVDKISTYAIFRKSSKDNDFSLVAIGGKTANSFTDKNISYNETYSYYIITKNNSLNVDSEQSNILSISISPKNYIIKLKLDSKTMFIGDFEVFLDTAPISIYGRTMLPIRPVIEAVDGNINWNADTKKITISRGNTEILLWIGKNYGLVNGNKVLIDFNNPKIVPTISGGRTLLPARFISEQLGANIIWDDLTKEITLNF